MLKIITLSLLFISQFSILKAQKPIDDAIDQANQLQGLFEDASLALAEFSSEYRFYLDQKSSTLKVSNQENQRIISLKANAEHVIRYYYDENSTIDNYSLENSKGREYPHSTYNGHYEVENVFYTDAKISACAFSAKLKGEQMIFSLQKTFHDPKYLTKIFFHNKLPARARLIKLFIPREADVEILEMNFDDYVIKKKEEVLPEGRAIIYQISNLDGLPQESNLPGHLHFMPHLLVLTKSYQVNGNQVKVLASVDDLYAWYSSLTKQLNNDPAQLQGKVEEIIGGLNDEESKMKALYYWVQDNIKYIAFMDGIAGFKPADAHEVFYNRYGDCKGMANLLKEMLKIAGIDARLTWVGTNIIPYNYDIPSLAVDNHMICTVFSGDKRIIMDPTEKFQSMEGNGERIQGREILIEDGLDYIIDQVPQEPLEQTLEETSVNYKLEENSLLAEGRSYYSGENLKTILSVLSYLDHDKKDVFLRDAVSGVENTNYFRLISYSEPDRDRPFEIVFTGDLQNHFNTYDDEIYLALDFEKDFSYLKFDHKRKSPFDFGKRIYKKTTGKLLIPSGYQVQYFPQPVKIENENYHFNLNYEIAGNQINYRKEIKIYNSVVQVKDFEDWNNIIHQLNNFYNDQVILKPIN